MKIELFLNTSNKRIECIYTRKDGNQYCGPILWVLRRQKMFVSRKRVKRLEEEVKNLKQELNDVSNNKWNIEKLIAKVAKYKRGDLVEYWDSYNKDPKNRVKKVSVVKNVSVNAQDIQYNMEGEVFNNFTIDEADIIGVCKCIIKKGKKK